MRIRKRCRKAGFGATPWSVAKATSGRTSTFSMILNLRKTLTIPSLGIALFVIPLRPTDQ
jgi:hypothetical protein